MRFALAALALAFAAPAMAQTPIKFPEKLQRTDFQAMIADAGPLYIAGQPTEAAFREMVTKEGIKTIINLRTQQEMDNRRQVPFDEAAVAKELGINYVHIPLGGPDVQQLSVVEKKPGGLVGIRQVMPVRFTQLELS
jgi:hypothetical protein